ncbi:Toprim domain-containing protein [Prosthecobacter debontii]|uniref:Toprim domain-containing protein n=1 Tax=Prosthecobacter debontii TaxID=48467 RepID=A0A1T4X807_9BACT|nr:CHC2 zinc finger domain-containing protein [Prosthecobacter debontii]SKA85722.1 Toprim domain-containing protein [Prosthecobacter debontii]
MSTATMPRGDFVDFKEVKSRITITQILERYDLIRTLKRSGDRLSGPCPIHRGTNPTQFRVSVSKNCWNCFGNCGRGGNIIDFVSLREGLPFREAALLLQEWFMPDKAGSTLAESSVVHSRRSHAPSPPLPEGASGQQDASEDDEAGENPPLSFELKTLKADHPYLGERGLTGATVQSYGLGLCGRGCLRGYIAIPVKNRDGKLVAYIGRWPGTPPEDKPKYKLPKGFKKRLELFNIDRAVQVPDEQPLLVVEGVFDCLRLVQLGYPRTVALLGSSLSARQEILIRDAVGEGGQVCLMLDADEAGRHGASDAASRLSRSCSVRALDIGEYRHQPEQLEKVEIEALLRTR